MIEDPSGPHEIRQVHRVIAQKHGNVGYWDETYRMCQVIGLEIYDGVPADDQPDTPKGFWDFPWSETERVGFNAFMEKAKMANGNI